MRKLMALSLFVLLLVLGIPNPALAAGGTTHVKALGPDKSQALEDAIVYPNDFEAAAAAHPDANNLVFVSLCRRARFTSVTGYSALSAAHADAVVGDPTRTVGDGT